MYFAYNKLQHILFRTICSTLTDVHLFPGTARVYTYTVQWPCIRKL